MTLLDTSVLIECLTAGGSLWPAMERALRRHRPFALCAPVLYEWLRGPRTHEELDLQRQLFPSAEVAPFGPEEAALAAELYRRLPRARTREMDIAIAACALRQQATLWTLNPADFSDIPGLELAPTA